MTSKLQFFRRLLDLSWLNIFGNILQTFCILVLGSDVVYSEAAVEDLLSTLKQICGCHTTVFVAGELRNGSFFFSETVIIKNVLSRLLTYNLCLADAVLEYFLEGAMKEFVVGRVDQSQWHPDYRSDRVALYILVKK